MALWSLEPSWLSYLGGSYESLVTSTQACLVQEKSYYNQSYGFLWMGIYIRYVAFEYANSGLLNKKCDVYSFAVVLLEAITGRDPVNYGCSAPEGVHPCDKRSINQYQCLFLAIDFSLAKSDEDTLWKANVRETKEEVAVRGMNFKKYLLTRRERERWLLLLIVDSCFIHYPHLVMTVTLQSRKKSLSSKFSCY
ncbi:unnamed protein product [Coffea canephora]|uniref:non-specific serine/threonine protein kinase n=1 Tax=Coffea canephora TaxID=49390 RepID=A0A068UL34_COFCA|nr:unnamed protein product [Coffea canephora]